LYYTLTLLFKGRAGEGLRKIKFVKNVLEITLFHQQEVREADRGRLLIELSPEL
jgi:hypothetical protein